MDAVDTTMEKLEPVPLPRASGIRCGQVSFPFTSPRPQSHGSFEPSPTQIFTPPGPGWEPLPGCGELSGGLAELGLVLDAAEMEGVCRRWDRDGGGTLDLEEFLRPLRVSWGATVSFIPLGCCGGQGPLCFYPRSPPHPPQPPCPRPRGGSCSCVRQAGPQVVMAW